MTLTELAHAIADILNADVGAVYAVLSGGAVPHIPSPVDILALAQAVAELLP